MIGYYGFLMHLNDYETEITTYNPSLSALKASVINFLLKISSK